MSGRPLQASPVSFEAHVARLPKGGMPVVIEADERQRDALAAAHGLQAVTGYRAELTVTSWKSGGVRVSGRVDADIVQACVVTLEPIDVQISEDVSALFVPADSRLGRPEFAQRGEIVLDAEGPDSPEPFTGDTIDVGALAEEFFALAIDPYPRKAGVAEAVAVDADSAETGGPLFEKLKSLRPKS